MNHNSNTSCSWNSTSTRHDSKDEVSNICILKFLTLAYRNQLTSYFRRASLLIRGRVPAWRWCILFPCLTIRDDTCTSRKNSTYIQTQHLKLKFHPIANWLLIPISISGSADSSINRHFSHDEWTWTIESTVFPRTSSCVTSISFPWPDNFLCGLCFHFSHPVPTEANRKSEAHDLIQIWLRKKFIRRFSY